MSLEMSQCQETCTELIIELNGGVKLSPLMPSHEAVMGLGSTVIVSNNRTGGTMDVSDDTGMCMCPR